MGSKQLTGPVRRKYLNAVRRGASNRAAARAAGIGHWVTRMALQSDPEFAADVATAQEEAVQAEAQVNHERENALWEREQEVEKALTGLVTITDAAKRLGVSVETLRARAKRGALPLIRTPFGRLVDLEALRREVAA